MDSSGSIKVIASIDTSQYKKGAKDIEHANSSIEDSTNKASSSTNRFTSTLSTFARRGAKVAAVGIAGLATAIATMTIKGGISRALNIEDAQAKLKGLGHDAKSVENIMVSALDSVIGTAYGLDAAATIAAGAVAAGVEPGKQLTKYLKMTADAATIAGTSLSEMGPIMNRVQTQQRAYSMELNMLADRGIPIYQWLQEEMGVTASALRKMVSDGKIDSATYFRVIEKNIGGAALESGKTTRGAWANMLAAMSRVGQRIVTGPISNVRDGFGTMTKWIDANSDNIVNAVQRVLDTMLDLGRGAVSVGKFLWSMRTTIISLTSAWIAYRMAVVAVNTIQRVQALYAAATATQYVLLNGTLVTVRNATVAQTVAQAALNNVMKLSPIGIVTAAIVGITTAYIAATTQTDRNKSATDRLNAARRQAKIDTDNLKEAEGNLKRAQLDVEGATLAVERAQRAQNEAIRQYGPKSLEAREASHQLKVAQDGLATANKSVTEWTNSATEAQKNFAKTKEAIKQANAEIAGSAYGVASGYQSIATRVQEAHKEMSKSPTRTGVAPSKSLIPSITGRASGGPVNKGTPYFVGENPDGSLNSTSELFVPNQSGRIISSKSLQSYLGNTGGSVEYNIQNINISNEVDGERWLRRLSGNQEIVSNGLVPTQSYM